MGKKNKEVETITTTTFEIVTNQEKMTETIAMLQLSDHFGLEGTDQGFVKASRYATRSFSLCGDYLKATANFAMAEEKMQKQIEKVKGIKKEYEEALRLEKVLKDECADLWAFSKKVKKNVGQAFRDAGDAWSSDTW
jgi:hypothetical protein